MIVTLTFLCISLLTFAGFEFAFGWIDVSERRRALRARVDAALN